MSFSIYRIESKGHEEAHLLHPYNTSFFAFAFLTEGELLAEVEGRNILLTPGQFILVPENKIIKIHYFRKCQGFDGHFSIRYLKDASYSVLQSRDALVQSFWFDDAVFMGALLSRMVTAFEDKDKLFLQSGLDLILGQLRPSGRIAVVPEKFLSLVFDRERTPMSVSQYAAILGVTANYLNKTVKAHTHRTAIDWIELARLNIAKQLLRDPSVPIMDVAFRTGVDDQSYFSRFFKKKTGLTPSQFRSGGK